MENSFWVNRWKNNQIGFHAQVANPLLVKHFHALSLDKRSRVFIPLCGKSLDIRWLLSQGYHVVGVELVQDAIEQLFSDLEIVARKSTINKQLRYSAPGIDIFVGNIFDLTAEIVGEVDATYDRAALVALPGELRKKYAAHVIDITSNAPQLLISYVYDQNAIAGPPFSVTNEEMIQHYSSSYKPALLETIEVVGGLKGKCTAAENLWLLQLQTLSS